jgi:hypothetical protein
MGMNSAFGKPDRRFGGKLPPSPANNGVFSIRKCDLRLFRLGDQCKR